LDNGSPPIRVTQEQLGKMNAAERWDYTRQFAQHLDSGRKA
jgi:hypothetical protein